MTRHSITRATRVYLLLEGTSAFIFQLALTLYVVYYATIAGLDALQIVLLGTVFETTIFLFEIPTGIAADVYSRKGSIIAGYALMGAAWLVEGIAPLFGILLLAEVISGIGATFMSGATEAWISDEIGADAAGRAFMRAAQFRVMGSILGVFASVALAGVDLRLPILATGILLLALAVCLAFIMPETGFRVTPSDERSTWRGLWQTFRAGVRHVRVRPALMILLLIGFMFGFHSEGFDMLWQKHVLDNIALPAGISTVAWFGMFSLGAQAASLALQLAIRNRVKPENAARSVQVIYGVTAVSLLMFALAGNVWLAMGAFWLITALRTAAKPLTDAWLNQHFTPHLRATLFSMSNQISSSGEIAGGIPVGAVGRGSLRIALAACAMILALTLPLFRVVRHKTWVE